MSGRPGENGLRGIARLHTFRKERDGRPFRVALNVVPDGRGRYVMTLAECGHKIPRQFPAAHGAYCDVCGLEKALGEKLAKPPSKSLTQRALELRGSYVP